MDVEQKNTGLMILIFKSLIEGNELLASYLCWLFSESDTPEPNISEEMKILLVKHLLEFVKNTIPKKITMECFKSCGCKEEPKNKILDYDDRISFALGVLLNKPDIKVSGLQYTNKRFYLKQSKPCSCRQYDDEFQSYYSGDPYYLEECSPIVEFFGHETVVNTCKEIISISDIYNTELLDTYCYCEHVINKHPLFDDNHMGDTQRNVLCAYIEKYKDY